jgi:pimeloyl-ACP methyl ester carboxylesterase
MFFMIIKAAATEVVPPAGFGHSNCPYLPNREASGPDETTIGGAEFISLPGHGHNLHWEDPEEVAGLIRTFLDRP